VRDDDPHRIESQASVAPAGPPAGVGERALEASAAQRAGADQQRVDLVAERDFDELQLTQLLRLVRAQRLATVIADDDAGGYERQFGTVADPMVTQMLADARYDPRAPNLIPALSRPRAAPKQGSDA
jgi:hypothetical protein